jgi:hypothetical protein
MGQLCSAGGLLSHVIVFAAGAEVPLGLGVCAVGGAIGPLLGRHDDQKSYEKDCPSRVGSPFCTIDQVLEENSEVWPKVQGFRPRGWS